MHYTGISFLIDIAQICFSIIKPQGNYFYYKPSIKPLGSLLIFIPSRWGLFREGVLIERGANREGNLFKDKSAFISR